MRKKRNLTALLISLILAIVIFGTVIAGTDDTPSFVGLDAGELVIVSCEGGEVPMTIKPYINQSVVLVCPAGK